MIRELCPAIKGLGTGRARDEFRARTEGDLRYENRVRDGLRRGGGVAGRGCVRSLVEFRAVHSNEA